MGHLVTSKQNNAGDKSVKPVQRVHGTPMVPSDSKTRKKGPYGSAFHKPRQSGAVRPFGPR